MRAWVPGWATTSRPGAGGGMPNGSLSPWTTSTGTATASSSSSRLFSGFPGGWTGKARQRTPAGAGVGGRAAGDAGARRAPARDQGQPAERIGAQVLDDGRPRRVELARRGLRAAAGNAVGLLDERDAHLRLERRLRRRHEVARRHAAARAVAEHERPAGVLRRVQVRERGPVRRVDLDRGHAARLRIRASHGRRTSSSPASA